MFNKLNSAFLSLIIIFLLISLYIVSNQCNSLNSKEIIKYIPRDFDTQQDYPDLISVKFKDMFKEPTPYIQNLGNNILRVNV